MLSKCEFPKGRVEVPSYIIGSGGLEADPREASIVANARLHET